MIFRKIRIIIYLQKIILKNVSNQKNLHFFSKIVKNGKKSVNKLILSLKKVMKVTNYVPRKIVNSTKVGEI